jgi:hypothetical protein
MVLPCHPLTPVAIVLPSYEKLYYLQNYLKLMLNASTHMKIYTSAHSYFSALILRIFIIPCHPLTPVAIVLPGYEILYYLQNYLKLMLNTNTIMKITLQLTLIS